MNLDTKLNDSYFKLRAEARPYEIDRVNDFWFSYKGIACAFTYEKQTKLVWLRLKCTEAKIKAEHVRIPGQFLSNIPCWLRSALQNAMSNRGRTRNLAWKEMRPAVRRSTLKRLVAMNWGSFKRYAHLRQTDEEKNNLEERIKGHQAEREVLN